MTIRTCLFLSGLAAALALAGCGHDKKAQGGKAGDDPALNDALAGQLMVDPDLVNQNNGSAAIAGGGPAVMTLPLIERSPEAIAAAKDDAARLAGGNLKHAPMPDKGDAESWMAGVTAAQLALGVKGPGKDCAAKTEYAMAWSLQLPEPLAIYPRGHLEEAAGTDRDGCQLRVAGFVTAAEPVDIIDFYYTRLTAAGFAARHRLAGDVRVLNGRKGGADYSILVIRRDDGLTRVNLIVNGG